VGRLVEQPRELCDLTDDTGELRSTAIRTDRQTDKQTNRETERQRERQRDRETERQTDRQTDRETDRQTERQRDRHIDTNTHKRTKTATYVDMKVEAYLHSPTRHGPFAHTIRLATVAARACERMWRKEAATRVKKTRNSPWKAIFETKDVRPVRTACAHRR
jgi:hypothetical protein